MKRWTILAAAGCLALLAVIVMAGLGRMGPSVADANENGNGVYTVHGVVWDDTADINGIKDAGEGAPSADVDLHLCPDTDTWECREQAGTESTSIDGDGNYEFADLEAGDYTVCLDVTPATEWTLTMVQKWGTPVDASDVHLRCIEVEVGSGDVCLDWGIANVPSKLSVTKVCDSTSLAQEEIECTITAKNEGETVLLGTGVEDYYSSDDFGFVDADPSVDFGDCDNGDCWVLWDVGDLYPGEEAIISIVLAPQHTTGTAHNCVWAAAWNVGIPTIVVAPVSVANANGGYDAYWEDVVAPERCVTFGERPHRRATATPTEEPPATPTEAPPPPPTATTAPPPPPPATATPYGGPAGIGISPPATGTGITSQEVPHVAWWLAGFGVLALGVGGGVALALRRMR
jgi:hypothetical protein